MLDGGDLQSKCVSYMMIPQKPWEKIMDVRVGRGVFLKSS